jgi:hypothetical protein
VAAEAPPTAPTATAEAPAAAIPATANAVCQARVTCVHFGARGSSLTQQNRNAIEQAVDAASVCDLQQIQIVDSANGATSTRRASAVCPTLIAQGVPADRIAIAEEADARSRRVGVWQGEAEPPWTYRERRWLAEAPTAPSGCAIKGKITKNGHIYHTPWSPWYTISKVDERRGERWFCTEAEATEAGWRPAGARW